MGDKVEELLPDELERVHGNRAIDGLFVQVSGPKMMQIIRELRRLHAEALTRSTPLDNELVAGLVIRLRAFAQFWRDQARYPGEQVAFDDAADMIERLSSLTKPVCGLTSEEAVERVARAMCETAPKPCWSDLTEVRREGFRVYARAALASLPDGRRDE